MTRTPATSEPPASPDGVGPSHVSVEAAIAGAAARVIQAKEQVAAGARADGAVEIVCLPVGLDPTTALTDWLAAGENSGVLLTPTHRAADAARDAYYEKSRKRGWKRSGLLRQLPEDTRRLLEPFVARGHQTRDLLRALEAGSPDADCFDLRAVEGNGTAGFGVHQHLGLPPLSAPTEPDRPHGTAPLPVDAAPSVEFVIGSPAAFSEFKLRAGALRSFIDSRRAGVLRDFFRPRLSALRLLHRLLDDINATHPKKGHVTYVHGDDLKELAARLMGSKKKLRAALDTGPDGPTAPFLRHGLADGPLVIPADSSAGRALLGRNSAPTVSAETISLGLRGAHGWARPHIDIMLIGLCGELLGMPHEVTLRFQVEGVSRTEIRRFPMTFSVAISKANRPLAVVRRPWGSMLKPGQSFILVLGGLEAVDRYTKALAPRSLDVARVTDPAKEALDHQRMALLVGNSDYKSAALYSRLPNGRLRLWRGPFGALPVLRKKVPAQLARHLCLVFEQIAEHVGGEARVALFVPGLLKELLLCARDAASQSPVPALSVVVRDHRLEPIVEAFALHRDQLVLEDLMVESFGKARGGISVRDRDAVVVLPVARDWGSLQEEARLLKLDPSELSVADRAHIQRTLLDSLRPEEADWSRATLSILFRPLERDRQKEKIERERMSDWGFECIDARRDRRRPTGGAALATERVVSELMQRHGCVGPIVLSWLHRGGLGAYEAAFGPDLRLDLDLALGGNRATVKKRAARACQRVFRGMESKTLCTPAPAWLDDDCIVPPSALCKVYEVTEGAWGQFCAELAGTVGRPEDVE